MPSPPSARSLERRREKAARFPRTCSVLQSGYIPLHFAALPTLPRNNPEITSLPVCANAAQTGWRDGLGPVSRMKRGGPGGTAFRVVPASSLHAGAVPASPSRMCSSGCGFAPCGSGPGSVGGVFSRRRGVRLPCRGECPGKGRIQKKTASSGASGRAVTASVRPCPAKRAFASVMDNGAFCACSATVPVARPLGREREFDGGPGRVPVAPAAWGAFQTQQGFASPRPALFPVDLAVGEE